MRNSIRQPDVNNPNSSKRISFSAQENSNRDKHGKTSRGRTKRIIIRVLIYVMVGALGFGLGAYKYVTDIFSQPFVYMPFVNNQDYVPVEFDAFDDFDMSGDTASSWSEGGHTRVYTNNQFPIKKVTQKDKNVENILVFGVDSRGSSDVQCRADAILVVSFDSNTKSVKLISLMRDTGVTIEGRSNIDKLGHSYTYGGVGLLINTINDNFGLDIQRFVMLDFNSSSDIINHVGGIEIDVQSVEVKYANININEQNRLFGTSESTLTHAGNQNLSGLQAVAWSRIRYSDSDFVRTSRQRTLAYSLMRKVSSLSKLDQLALMEDLVGAFETNMEYSDLFRVGMLGINLVSTTSEYRVPDDGMYQVQQTPWMMIVDWEKQITELHQFIWGVE